MTLIRTLIRRWKITVPAAGVVLAGLAWLAFGYFGIHTAFIDNKVDEAAPVFDAAPAMVVDEADGAADDDGGADGGSVAATPARPDTTVEPGAADTPVAESVPAEPAPAEAAAPEVVTEYAGQFTGLSRYDVSGDAIVLGNGTGQRFLRFENFDSSNGPDLNVYLVNPDDPDDFIDLGDLSGNIGNQNYEIPADVDLDRYSQVSIWCVRFSVGFGTADLMPTA